MYPENPLPIHSRFHNPEENIESLLSFVTSNELFSSLVGGVHILDFLIQEPDLYSTVLPDDWRIWFQLHDISSILDLLLRENLADLESLRTTSDRSSLRSDSRDRGRWRGAERPPESLLEYIIAVRTHALTRDYGRKTTDLRDEPLPRHIAVGMKPKKIHEVQNFARYLDRLSESVSNTSAHQVTHLVDFGSGQNYLGRTLASPPHNRSVVALESKPHNITGARKMDVHAKLAEKKRTVTNKKLHRQNQDLNHAIPVTEPVSQEVVGDVGEVTTRAGNDFSSFSSEGPVAYIETMIRDGDMSRVVQAVDTIDDCSASNVQLMVVSLHSCGNLIHHGLRSLVLNPAVKVVAMVGCCYNLVTERLGPPTYKLPSLRRPNERLDRTGSACDPHGFPMSERLVNYRHAGGEGIRFNITARMMACQAPQNWTEQDCESFFTRHFYRALLQRILLDRKVVSRPKKDSDKTLPDEDNVGPGLTIGSLRKTYYESFVAYVRGAIIKISQDPVHGARISKGTQNLTNAEIADYEERFRGKKKELSILWSLMAFSAILVESAMVVDRWLYLKEQTEVENCWVENVFDYKQSPRNLVVVGVKR